MWWWTVTTFFGDGVNIAARLQELAEPGSICVSAKLRDEVGRKLDFSFDDLGERKLKNIAAPVRVYRLRSGTAGLMASQFRNWHEADIQHHPTL